MSHSFAPGAVAFDDPNLMADGGLVAVMGLAEKAGLHELAGEHVDVPGEVGANPAAKVGTLVAGMVAGADDIAGMDGLRHGGTGKVLVGGRAASTLGMFLRGFGFGHVRQLDAVHARLTENLSHLALLLGGAGQVTAIDIDDTVKAT